MDGFLIDEGITISMFFFFSLEKDDHLPLRLTVAFEKNEIEDEFLLKIAYSHWPRPCNLF